MNISIDEYAEITKKYSNNSKMLKNCINAFLVGGLICTFGQVLMNVYTSMHMTEKDSSTLMSVTLILIAAILTGIGVYDDIAKVAGAGTIVPITGFSNAVTSPALEFKHEGYVMGISSKLYVIAGPVITYGLTASIIYGIIIYIMSLV